LSAKARWCYVVDDLGNRGYALLHVIWQLEVLDTPKARMVIGSAGPTACRCRRSRRTLRVLDAKADAPDSMPSSECARYKSSSTMHVERFGTLPSRCERLTGGNAFILAEKLRMGSPEEVVERWTVPPAAASSFFFLCPEVISNAVSELGRETTGIL